MVIYTYVHRDIILCVPREMKLICSSSVHYIHTCTDINIFYGPYWLSIGIDIVILNIMAQGGLYHSRPSKFSSIEKNIVFGSKHYRVTPVTCNQYQQKHHQWARMKTISIVHHHYLAHNKTRDVLGDTYIYDM